MKNILMPLGLLFTSILPHSAHSDTHHPFDDLDSEEIQKTVKILRTEESFGKNLKFMVLKKAEPPKEGWLSGKIKNYRQAFCVVLDPKTYRMHEAQVDLIQGKILSKKLLTGLMPYVGWMEEYEEARQIAMKDERWLKAMKDRGIKKEEVLAEAWAPGMIRPDEKKPHQRLLRVISYFKGKGNNYYSRPIEGFIANVDMIERKVVSVFDTGIFPIPSGPRELEVLPKPTANPFHPVQTEQRGGPSFKVQGQEVSWQNWKFRFSMDPMQGLQLHHIRYQDGDQERSVIYKLSLSDMLVPYGDPAKTWSFRNAFDVGEYGIGKLLHPLVEGVDAPAIAKLIEVVIPSDDGESTSKKAIAIYERDRGLLWKHRNLEMDKTDFQKSQELVVRSMAVVGNYDYAINTIFKIDGSIEVEVELTGILLAQGSNFKENPCKEECHPLVESYITAPPHQHFFNFRIDFDVDGANKNGAVEMNIQPLKKGNPDANGFHMVNTSLDSEKKGVRDLHSPSARMWKVVNTEKKNSLGHPTGYGLMPGETAYSYMGKGHEMRKRAGFIEHPAWFTQYHEDEMSGTSPYPTTAPGGEGLPRYISNDEKLDSQDIVFWYTFGVTHFPRPEEWPVMSVHRAGFKLVPIQFFTENPALKVDDGVKR